MKYVFTKRIQVCEDKLVTNFTRSKFVPEAYLESIPNESPDDETPDDETHPILLPKRIIRIPIHDRVYHYICECYKPVVSRSASSYWFISHRASSVDSI
mgnify:FL=1